MPPPGGKHPSRSSRAQLFGMIFGSEKFDRYVGELSMQSDMTAAMGMEEDGGGMEALPGFLGGGNDQKQAKRIAVRGGPSLQLPASHPAR
eukprot:SAG11_NODE_387_length_9883_cov_9.365699_5_plen_90_part_00